MTTALEATLSTSHVGRQDEIKDTPGFTTETLVLARELASGRMRAHGRLSLGGDFTAEILEGFDSLWVVLRRVDAASKGGFALRAAYAPGPALEVTKAQVNTDSATFTVGTAVGDFDVQIRIPTPDQPMLRCTVTLTPASDLILPYWPRDLYALGEDDDPRLAHGRVEAAQRGLNAGVVYTRLARPAFGALLYLQDLTTLNAYFNATDTKPDGVVGGDWPELGYLMPVCVEHPLPAGKPMVVSNALLCLSPELPADERATARMFLEMLACVYPHLERPQTEFHPWPQMAQKTVDDLERSPKATIDEHGYTYLHPYTDSEYPDSMVQITVLTTLREFAAWKGEHEPLIDALRLGVPNFFDIRLQSIRRYLPSVGDDKNANEVDSWYLYHPLCNLGRLALEGDTEARELFLKSLEFGIRVAHRFEYRWPIQYDVNSLEPIKTERKPGDPGQSDVGGLYAYTTLLAHKLTGEKRYIDEACAALRATGDLQFELAYQMNLTAWGAVASLWLWRETGDDFFRDQSYVFLASLFHNAVLWDSRIDNARHYLNFLGLTCLHDGPYMAIYECYESFCALWEYLQIGGDDLPESVVMLLTEYGKYALSRAWYFYPSELPQDVLATEIRNGHIDRELAFPLEDLYADGQPAGQVGQEIYGCGAALAFTTRAFHRPDGAPFLLYTEYPLDGPIETDGSSVKLRLRGVDGFHCRLRLLPIGSGAMPPVRLRVGSHRAGKVEGQQTFEGQPAGHEQWEFDVPAGKQIEICW